MFRKTLMAGAIAAGALLWSPAAAAPSFDCVKAATVVEKTICATTALGDADRKLSETYNAKLGLLSGEGREALRDGQRQWLRFIRILCDTTGIPKDYVLQPSAQCLAEKYGERLEELKAGVDTIGGITFGLADTFRAVPPKRDDSGESDFRFSTLEVSYPRIDRPKTPSERGFNAYFESLAWKQVKAFGDGGEDMQLKYTSLEVSPKLVSVATEFYSYPHGAAHGMYGGSLVHWLRAEGRRLRADDMFDAKTSWKDFIRQTCFKDVAEFGFIKQPGELGDMPLDPRRWSFTRDGMTIDFYPYEVASYADGEQSVEISWAALKPYLSHSAPVPFMPQ